MDYTQAASSFLLKEINEFDWGKLNSLAKHSMIEEVKKVPYVTSRTASVLKKRWGRTDFAKDLFLPLPSSHL